ncbi:hypothetical protein O9G_004940 [Rozella allomycis CSF55]|uniref:Uncharacterized protein n=1 Tax=Rozella allomycis (strain CSF55) TaxID=988480 RepID=A0A075AMS0_ROZAC|nr:hypothetical protein O9G_004940 [Rozella allomycis CSF55]|eukprot:EPZ30971.1 hypothetical protein O9G_004940 [Rozella allomycis CSF55]
MIDRFIAEYFRLELHDFFDESIDDIYEQYTSVKNQNLEEKTNSYKGEVTQDITTRISDLSWYLIIKKENLSLTAPRLLSKELLFSRFIKKFNLCRNNFDNSRFRRTKTLEESPIMDSIIEFKHLHAKTKMVKELLVKYRCKFKETTAVMSELFDLCLNDIKKVEPIVRRAHWASSLSIIVHSMLVDYLYCPINPINVPFPIFFEDYDVSKVPDFIKNGELNIKHYRDDDSNLLNSIRVKDTCDHEHFDIFSKMAQACLDYHISIECLPEMQCRHFWWELLKPIFPTHQGYLVRLEYRADRIATYKFKKYIDNLISLQSCFCEIKVCAIEASGLNRPLMNDAGYFKCHYDHKDIRKIMLILRSILLDMLYSVKDVTAEDLEKLTAHGMLISGMQVQFFVRCVSSILFYLEDWIITLNDSISIDMSSRSDDFTTNADDELLDLEWEVNINRKVEEISDLIYSKTYREEFNLQKLDDLNLRNESWEDLGPKLDKLFHGCSKIKESAKILIF